MGELLLIEDGAPQPPPEDLFVEEPGGSHEQGALMVIQDQLSKSNLYGPSGPGPRQSHWVTPGAAGRGHRVADLTTVGEVLDVVDAPDALHPIVFAEIPQ